MPSRKREKRKARQAKGDAPPGDDRQLNHPCTHGLDYCPCSTCCSENPTLSSDHLRLDLFIQTLFGAAFKENILSGIAEYGGAEVSRAMATAHKKHPEVLTDDTLRGMLKAYLVHQGTEMLFRNNLPEDVLRRDERLIEKLGHNYAAAILLIENYDPSKDHDPSKECFTHVAKLKYQDIFEGCTRSVVQFFYKRAPCNCLDKKYAALKLKPKTGVCAHCNERQCRSSLMICAGCNMRQFCSQECQQADWPFHETYCGQIGGGGPDHYTAMSLLFSFSILILVKQYGTFRWFEWGIIMSSTYCYGVKGAQIYCILWMLKYAKCLLFTWKVYNDEVHEYMFSMEAHW
eukprot:CAMPEP_0172315920 /NCGR_PEP_ID=MMETSP1058-20130122/26698_1 /TAXON_ID=83371 /ORGANISM="Detonula confervacea, Strain CCMP 353" /LENGTH=344 /DNA_ID=CAMNT_0013030117 /DNA_START=156 /DNA_END=1187 /DNA_ORIENTATION=-